jgi:hypothetical protein
MTGPRHVPGGLRPLPIENDAAAGRYPDAANLTGSARQHADKRAIAWQTNDAPARRYGGQQRSSAD